jgi:tetratricopeptide (TPR) repeat protein
MYPHSRLNGELLILLGEYYYHAGDYDQAAKYLAAVAEVKTDAKTLTASRAKLAEVRLAQGDLAAAVSQYLAVAETAEDEEEALAALYRAAEIYERAGNRSAAIDTYGDLVQRFGVVRATAKAQFKIGENMRLARLYKESNGALAKLAREWPATEYSARGELYRGLNSLELGVPAEAVEPLAAAAAGGERAVAVQAYYYLGLAERTRGRDEAAREYFGLVLTNYRDFPEWVRKASVELKRK